MPVLIRLPGQRMRDTASEARGIRVEENPAAVCDKSPEHKPKAAPGDGSATASSPGAARPQTPGRPRRFRRDSCVTVTGRRDGAGGDEVACVYLRLYSPRSPINWINSNFFYQLRFD